MQEQSDTYKSILKPSKGIYKEKNSKFLSFAFPVETEDQVKKHIKDLKKEFFDAKHHCYAFILGAQQNTFRSSDDKEPSGTAGKPILGQLHAYGLTNVLLVVVRYFGGTLLGTAGLANAYRSAAMNALHNATIVECTVNTDLELSFDYNAWNDIMQIIKKEKLQILKQQFDMKCFILISVRKSRIEQLEQKFKQIETLNLTVKT